MLLRLGETCLFSINWKQVNWRHNYLSICHKIGKKIANGRKPVPGKKEGSPIRHQLDNTHEIHLASHEILAVLTLYIV
jgi:hypothetical protein